MKTFGQPRSIFRRTLFEELVAVRLAQSLVGDDVRGGVEGGLNGELEGMEDEALLAEVVLQALGAGEVAQLADVGLDLRELLGDQLGVGHAGCSGRRR